MKRKVLALVLGCALTVTTLVGCGSSSTTSTTGDAATEAATESADAAATESTGDGLVYWSMWEATEPQGMAIQAAIDAYTEETGIPVDVQFKGRTGIREGLEPALAAGTKIDLFDEDIDRVNGTWGDYLLDLEDLTCDDAYADCMIGYHLGRLVGEEGVVDIVNNGKWDDPAVKQMADDYAELASKGYFSENIGSNVWPAGQNTELALGEVAMYLNGSWLPNEVKDTAGDDFQWGCFSYPAVDGGKTGVEAANYGAQVFAINKNSEKAQEAFDLICKITKGEFDQQLSADSIGIPADTTNTEWPALLQSVKPVMDSCTTRYSWAVGIESNNDMTPVIKENFIKLMAGTLDSQGFVDAMVAASK